MAPRRARLRSGLRAGDRGAARAGCDALAGILLCSWPAAGALAQAEPAAELPRVIVTARRVQDMRGGHVRNEAPAGTYTAIDAATRVSTPHAVPLPANTDLPAGRLLFARLTATHQPDDSPDLNLKATAGQSGTGSASGGLTGSPANQFGLFMPPRTVALQLTGRF
jgi:hypothetical protein